jgi:4-hydroxybenzoate polyprenyltransferase
LLQTEGDIPLVVNLDGLLVRSNFLLESLFYFLAGNSRAAIHLPRWIVAGRSCVRHELAARAPIDAELLPYDEMILRYLRNKRANGRRLVLVSASDQCIVDRVAKHLGLFEEAHGSCSDVALAGPARAKFLVQRFGERRFDYLGRAASDFPVWESARRIVTVDSAPALWRKADDRFPEAEHVLRSPPPSLHQRVSAYVAALRPNQWVKNLLIFVAMSADHNFTAPVVMASMIAFVAFSLTASSVYVLNDLFDLPYDRKHKWKRNRPFASGRVPIGHGIALFFGLLTAAIALSVAFLNQSFLLVLGIYIALTTLYSLRLKRVLVMDIIALAGLYTIRVVAGGVVTGIQPSEWLLALSLFIFVALAAVKRQSELVNLVRGGGARAPGRRYVASDLPMIRNFGTSAGYISVLVLALYIHSPEVGELYPHPQVLWGTCPLLLYWISRMLMKAHRGQIREDPIVFAFRDRASLIVGGAMAGFVLAAAIS